MFCIHNPKMELYIEWDLLLLRGALSISQAWLIELVPFMSGDVKNLQEKPLSTLVGTFSMSEPWILSLDLFQKSHPLSNEMSPSKQVGPIALCVESWIHFQNQSSHVNVQWEFVIFTGLTFVESQHAWFCNQHIHIIHIMLWPGSPV